MRIVVDTNVVLSGLIWRGAPHELIVHARTGAISLISSRALIAELAGVLARDKFRTILSRSGTDPQDLLGRVRLLLEIVEPPRLSTPVSRDPDDDEVRRVCNEVAKGGATSHSIRVGVGNWGFEDGLIQSK